MLFLKFINFTFFLFLLSACSSSDQKQELARSQNTVGEYIYRKDNEYLFHPDSPTALARELYPWESHSSRLITKDFFRCKGSVLNPAHYIQIKDENVRVTDCGGVDKHSLPLKDGKEFIYPILINLLNYIQDKSGQHVVITSGHRCPEHNTYVDPSKDNISSKHMIGAEVSFYLQGSEDKPEKVIELIQQYYLEKPEYDKQKEFQEFKRFNGHSNVSTEPWMNKEIFIKLFNKKEGRNFDNRHPYPYISIQVRFDMQTQEKVTYSWEKANRNFLRK